MENQTEKRYDVSGAIIDYEAGVMEWEAELELFQHLINTGLAWQLQGCYGRHAKNLITEGYCTRAKATS
jgi:hypothetical protein